jgi:hypothetical protein
MSVVMGECFTWLWLATSSGTVLNKWWNIRFRYRSVISWMKEDLHHGVNWFLRELNLYNSTQWTKHFKETSNGHFWISTSFEYPVYCNRLRMFTVHTGCTKIGRRFVIWRFVVTRCVKFVEWYRLCVPKHNFRLGGLIEFNLEQILSSYMYEQSFMLAWIEVKEQTYQCIRVNWSVRVVEIVPEVCNRRGKETFRDGFALSPKLLLWRSGNMSSVLYLQ